MPQGWTLPSELDRIPGYLAAWEKRPSWENTYYTVTSQLAVALFAPTSTVLARQGLLVPMWCMCWHASHGVHVVEI